MTAASDTKSAKKAVPTKRSQSRMSACLGVPQCELCPARLHRCSKQTNNHGEKTAGKGRYVNPRTKP